MDGETHEQISMGGNMPRREMVYVLETNEKVVLPPPSSNHHLHGGPGHHGVETSVNVVDQSQLSFLSSSEEQVNVSSSSLPTISKGSSSGYSQGQGSSSATPPTTRGRSSLNANATTNEDDVPVKRGGLRKRKYQGIRCDHAAPEHYFRSFVENAVKEEKASIIMNASMANSSIVWSYCGFPKINGEVCVCWLVCTLCNSVFAYTDGATSGPKRHVLVKHLNLPGNFNIASIRQGAGEESEALQSLLALDNVARSSEGGGLLKETYIATESSPVQSKAAGSHRGRSAGRPRKAVKNDNAGSSRNSGGGGVCTICNVDFRNLALFMMHRSCHGTQSDFQCSQCYREMSNVFDFWAHLHERQCEAE